MTKDMPPAPDGSKERSATASPRHPFGPRPIAALLPSVTRVAFRAGFRSIAGLIAEWPGIVGAQLADVTVPKRLAAGTLTLGCNGPVALELQHMAQPLMERINRHLGRAVVQRLKFVQDSQPRIATEARPAAVPARPPPKPIAGMPNGPLHDALASLGAMIPGDRA